MTTPLILGDADKDQCKSTPSSEMECFGPLHEAAGKGRLETCKYLVEQIGFDINVDANNDSGMCVFSC